MYTRDKWVRLLTTVSRLTKDGKIQWHVRSSDFARDVVGGRSRNVFSAEFKEREFLLAEIKRSTRMILSDMAEDMGGRAQWEDFQFYVKDKDKDEFVESPRIQGVLELYTTVYKNLIDLDGLLHDLSEEAEPSNSQDADG